MVLQCLEVVLMKLQMETPARLKSRDGVRGIEHRGLMIRAYRDSTAVWYGFDTCFT